MNDQTVSKALELIPEELDFTNDKQINEVRGQCIKAMEISQRLIENFERKGETENALRAELNFEKIVNNITKIDNLAKQSGTPMHDGKQRFQFGDEGGLANVKGKSLDKSGNIKLYAPNQKLAADHTPADVDLGGFLRSVVDKPRTNAERQMIQNSVDSSGYSMPTTIASELIDQLRAINPVIAAGARTISIDGLDSTKFVKITDDPDAVWHEELAEESLSDPTFGAVEMKPKTVLALTEISREVLQDAANIEEALTSTFVGSINQAILDATFDGGGDEEPTGLSSLITATEEYDNGDDPDWSHFVKASKTLHDENVPTEGRSFIHTPSLWEVLALAQDDNSRYQDAPSFIRDVPNLVSSGVPAGISYAGDFSNVVYGFRLNITLEQHNAYSARKYGTIWLAAARLDIAVFRPKAFVRIEEAES